ncbi:unnamed protein product [Haemonchus placei]|uniref:7TM_GPCR_Srx domain-containing protein n=1 Tax=Haemonchus placei TaxID=6290 RepID=A0A0N4W3F2_HAEPC|nr:unnamed protein product [Haemonchus placei]
MDLVALLIWVFESNRYYLISTTEDLMTRHPFDESPMAVIAGLACFGPGAIWSRSGGGSIKCKSVGASRIRTINPAQSS